MTPISGLFILWRTCQADSNKMSASGDCTFNRILTNKEQNGVIQPILTGKGGYKLREIGGSKGVDIFLMIDKCENESRTPRACQD